MSYGERLRKLRKRKGITQEDLAKILNVEKSSVSEYKRGRLPPLDTAQKIANYFGVSVDYMLGDTDYPYKINISEDFSVIADNDRLGFIRDFVAFMAKYEVKITDD
jgi:transcriptional regulator with XRE-family HTH domain